MSKDKQHKHALDRHIYDMVTGQLCMKVAFRLFYFMHLFSDLLNAADKLTVKKIAGVPAMQADLKNANALQRLPRALAIFRSACIAGTPAIIRVTWPLLATLFIVWDPLLSAAFLRPALLLIWRALPARLPPPHSRSSISPQPRPSAPFSGPSSWTDPSCPPASEDT
jgi:hypothetical protein